MRKFFWALVIVAILEGAVYYFTQTHVPAAVSSPTVAVPERKSVFIADARTKTTHCVVRDGLPDHACTPGAVFPEATRDIVCQSGYTKTVRNVPVALKRELYLEYDLSYPQSVGAYEADHLIPLELGGSNDITNLFPEAATPLPGFHQKDIVENYLHGKVCSGQMNLVDAQQVIAIDWLVVYHQLSSSELAQVRK